MKFKKLESGRSMVEMLGVLAIIGVLSVGGIAGYSLSMRRHRANQVVDLATKLGLVAYSIAEKNLQSGSCSGYRVIDFADAGVGSLPAGVVDMGGMFEVCRTDTQGDSIFFSAQFDDDKLCQAVGSVMGTGCQDKYVPFLYKYN